MTPERYARVRALYEALVDLSPEGRDAYLHQHAVDETLIRDVIELFDAGDSATTGWIDRPLRNALKEVTRPSVAIGDVVGVWRVTEQIGQSGMGSVFRVDRCDGHFEQTAAMKLLKGVPDQDHLDFFTRERQLLAKLSHPNIARLYDGGTTPSGQPYLVMELVDGRHIDQHVAASGLSTDAVLAMFIEACHAVAFAHRQLIVHCDIKPSNLLINAEGRPILLDFGIARLSDTEAAKNQSPSSYRAFTPRYASPEQQAGETVTTLSDIYSLGMLLGELIGDAGTSDAELAAVVAKAADAEPARRYPTVDALCDDLNRYRQHRPLQAVPASTAYVARKFLRRRWPVVATGFVFVATVAGFTARVLSESARAIDAEHVAVAARDRAQQAEAEAVQERDAKETARGDAVRERDRALAAEAAANEARAEALQQRDAATAAEHRAIAERNRATQAESAARQTNDFLISIFDSSSPDAESGDIPASRLIAEAEQRVEREMAGQPAIQAEIYSALGVVQANMGELESARTNLERAVAIERQQDRPLALAEMLSRLDRVVSSIDGAAASEPFASEALALCERHAAPNSIELAMSLVSMGMTASAKGRKDEADRYYERALAILETHHPETAEAADAYAAYGLHLRGSGDLAKALDYYERSIRLSGRILGEEHPTHLTNYEWYARTLVSLRRFDDAEAAFRRAIALRTKLHGEGNTLVTDVKIALANMLNDADRPREALALLLEAQPRVAAKSGNQSVEYIILLNHLAASHNHTGNYEAAIAASGEANRINDATSEAGVGHANLSMNLGTFQMRAGRMTEAQTSLLRAEGIAKKLLPATHPLVITAEVNLAEWHVRQHEWAKAEERLDRVQPNLPPSSPMVGVNHARLRALIAAGKGDYDHAIAELERVEKERFKLRGEKSALAWMLMIDRAEVLAQRGTPEDKKASVALATMILGKINGTFVPESPVVVRLKQLRQP